MKIYCVVVDNDFSEHRLYKVFTTRELANHFVAACNEQTRRFEEDFRIGPTRPNHPRPVYPEHPAGLKIEEHDLLDHLPAPKTESP